MFIFPSLKRWLDLLLLTITATLICILIHPLIATFSQKLIKLLFIWPSWMQYFTAALLVGGLWLILIRLGGFSLAHINPKNLLLYPPLWVFGLLGAILYIWLEAKYIPLQLHESGSLDIRIYLGSMLAGMIVAYILFGRIKDLTIVVTLMNKLHPVQIALGSLDDINYLLQWISDDAPIQNPQQDRFEHYILAKKIAQILLDRHLQAVGIVGPYGSGKSSLLNLIEHYIDNPREIRRVPQATATNLADKNFRGKILRCRIDGWGRNRGSIAQQILKMAVSRLSLEVDCLSIFTLPANYRKALTGTSGSLGTIVAALLEADDDPIDILKRMNDILKAANIRLIILLEDIDRNFTDDIIRDEMPALLDRLRILENMSFVLTISTEHRYSGILIRICEHVESLI